MLKKELTQITTLTEFTRWAEGLAPEEYLFRGIPNENYEVEASAYRRLSREEDRNLDKFLEINKELIKDARLRGHDQKNGQTLTDLEMLAELQHFRAATCLIDFTYSAQIALWFACQPSSEYLSNGKVIAVRNNPVRFKEITPQLLQRDIDYFLEGNGNKIPQMYQWEPRQQNNRIIAQQSIFLFGNFKVDADAKCTIPEDNKQNVLAALQHVSGITEAMLFPDFDGFARLRSHNVPYIQFNASDYRERGSQAHQRHDYKAALAYYDMAIQLDQNDAQIYFNRGLVRIELEQYKDALADFDNAIVLNPKNADAYNNRGYVKILLEQFDGALTDYDTAIQLNPDHYLAYYRRGSLYVQLGSFENAYEDLSEALRQAAQVGDVNLTVRIGQLLQEIESKTKN